MLCTLVEAEITARDASNTWARLKAATFPVVKTLDEFDLAVSSIPAPTFAYLSSLEWIPVRENLALIGPAGTGKSHTVIALGHAAVTAGYKVKYLTAADLVDTLYRGLADNTDGRVFETLLPKRRRAGRRGWVRPVGRHRRATAVRLVAAAYERRALGIGSQWSFQLTGAGSCLNTPPPSVCSTGCCTMPPRWSPAASPIGCARPKPG